MSAINLLIIVPPECEHYVESSARMRKISRSQLIRRTIELVMRDQMFLSVLDDANAPSTKTALVRRRSRMPPASPKAPADKLFDGLSPAHHSTPTRVLGSHFTRPQPVTREQQMRELQQAILNTGGELVK